LHRPFGGENGERRIARPAGISVFVGVRFQSGDLR
jgi:hypothetical protein